MSEGAPDPAAELARLERELEASRAALRAEEALRRKEEHLRRAQHVEVVGLLAAEVAHHMNNVLMGVTGCARAALIHVAEDNPAQRFLHEILRSTEQGATLMRHLAVFSRKRAHHPEVIDLNEVVRSLATLLRRLCGGDITVETSLDPAAWSVLADAVQIEQVLMSLVINARDAMPEGGRITIETRNVVVSQAPAPPRRGPMPGEHVVLVVRDSGGGMDAATQASLFEPLITAKQDGSGTGLGLPTVQAIVEASHGHVAIESAVGRGTTVLIHLPRARPPGSHKPAPPALPPPAPGTETVLLVDDEESIRLALRHALESSGYQILDAQDGASALALSEQHTGPIHALITDLRMPGMNGVELARRVAAQRAGIRIIYMSAYAGGIRTRKRLRAESAALLEKPFPPEELLRRLRDILDRGAAPAPQPSLPAAAQASPASPGGEPAPPAEPSPRAAPAEPPTLLIVEDQAATRLALSRLLRAEGRRVLEAATGAEALRICRGARVDLLLTDVVLSDTTGVALAAELTALRPDLAVIFLSGHPRETLEERFHLPAGAVLVEKPVDFDDLERRVDEVMRRARA